MTLEHTIITVIIPALVLTSGIFCALLIASNPKKYFFCEGDK